MGTDIEGAQRTTSRAALAGLGLPAAAMGASPLVIGNGLRLLGRRAG